MKSTGHTEGKFMDSDSGWVRDTTPEQFANITVGWQEGTDPKEDGFEYFITGLIGAWTFEDINLLKESIENSFDYTKIKEGFYCDLFLEEDGEWDGFPHWTKYYTIKHIKVNI